MTYKMCVLSVLFMSSLSGCMMVADLVGADSSTLSLNANQNYQVMLQEAEKKQILDTKSATYHKVNRVFIKMKPYADQMYKGSNQFDWQVAVIKSDEINAYVAPGGKVVFYTGIVDQLKLDDHEVAAIMGHEMVHALEEHAKSKIGAQTLTDLAVNLGSQYVNQSLGANGGALLQLGSKFAVSLPYSRNLETRADKGGMILMAQAGYSPKAAISLWQKMNNTTGDNNHVLLKFASTHPSNQDRIANLEKMLPEALRYYKAP